MRKIIIYLSYTLLLITIFSVVSCKSDPQGQQQPNQEAKGDTKLDFLNAALSKDGFDTELRFQRAELLAEKQQYDKAIEDLRVAILTDSLQPKYYHLLADVFMDSNNSSKSLETMQVAAGLFPERIQTLLKLSETHYIIEQYESSIAVLNEVIRIDPTNAEAYFMLGLNFRALKDEKRAVNALQVATEFDSKLTDAWIVLSEIFEKSNPKKALGFLEAAKNVNPNNINVLHSLAYFHQNHNAIPKALEVYREINLLQRDYNDAYLNAGILYIELDSLPQAKERFDIMISNDPLDPKAYYYRGYTYSLLNNKIAAIADLKSAINLNPDYQKANELLLKLQR